MYKIFLLMLTIVASYQFSIAQKHTETVKRTLSFSSESNAFVVFVENINGMVEVEPSGTDEVLLQADIEITGSTSDIVEQGKQEVEIISKVLKDTILIYVVCPAINYYRHDKKRRYNYHSQRVEYDFKTAFKLKIPAKAMADISTINEGDVIIRNHLGAVKASNVNGNVYLENVDEVLVAHTVNGEIRINCQQSPKQNASFKTINGDIFLQYPQNLSANLKFKSFNGEFFTDYPITQYLPAQVKSSSKSRKGTTYKLEGYTIIKVGKGGSELQMETLNGDVFIGSKKL